MPLGKCGDCGNHPRSKLHVEKCGAGKKVRVEVELEFVKGSTCICCHTTYTVTPFPPFQEPDAKQGQYDVTRQLPRCSKDFPLCARCLPWYWRHEAKRLGVEKEVKEEYEGCFV